jgi:nucleoside-diphosphate-sugar epimerase
MSKHDLFVVAGTGGFIGGHLVKKLREEGFEKIRAVDQKRRYESAALVYKPASLLKGLFSGASPQNDEL